MKFEVVFTMPVVVGGKEEIRALMFNIRPRNPSPNHQKGFSPIVSVTLENNFIEGQIEHNRKLLEDLFDQFDYRATERIDLGRGCLIPSKDECSLKTILAPRGLPPPFFASADLLTPLDWTGDSHLVRIHLSTGMDVKPNFTEGEVDYENSVVYNRETLFNNADKLPFSDPYLNILLYDDLVSRELKRKLTAVERDTVLRSVSDFSREYRFLQVQTLGNALEKGIDAMDICLNTTLSRKQALCEAEVNKIIAYWALKFNYTPQFSDLKVSVNATEHRVSMNIENSRDYVECEARPLMKPEWRYQNGE